MSFLDIKDPVETSTLLKEYVTAMKTNKQRNMVTREMKLAIGDELQSIFHRIVNATKQATEETRKELTPMKKTSTDIDGALNRAAKAFKLSGPRDKNVDNIFGIYRRKDGQLQMGSKLVETSADETTLKVDDTEYKLTPGQTALITQKHPRPMQYTVNDYQEYGSLVKQTKVKSSTNKVKGSIKPYDT